MKAHILLVGDNQSGLRATRVLLVRMSAERAVLHAQCGQGPSMPHANT
jgi:hypothetical protein